MRQFRTLLILLAAGRFIAFIARLNIVPFYAELMAYHGAGYTGAGGLYSAFFLGYSLCLIPAGYLADRIDPLKQITVGLLLLAGAGAAVALSPSYGLALTARGVEGLAVAATYTASLKLVTMHIASNYRGKVLAIMEMAVGVGTFTALSIFPVLTRWIDYQWLLASVPLLCMGAVLLALFLRKGQAPAPAPERRQGSLRSLLNRDLLLVTLTTLLGLFSVNGILGWLSTYLTGDMGYDKAEAAVITAIILGCQIAAVYPAGIISDRLPRRMPLVHTGSVILMAGILVLMAKPGAVALYGGSVLLGIGMSWGVAPLTVITTELFGPERAGLAASITIAAAQAGSGLAGVIFGWLLDRTGSFQAIWILCLVLVGCRLVTGSLVRERKGAQAGAAVS